VNFFVPYLDDAQGEELRAEVRAVLDGLGLPTKERRIRRSRSVTAGASTSSPSG
jgi:hypothetical protein